MDGPFHTNATIKLERKAGVQGQSNYGKRTNETMLTGMPLLTQYLLVDMSMDKSRYTQLIWYNLTSEAKSGGWFTKNKDLWMTFNNEYSYV